MPPRRVVHKKFGAARASGAGRITQIGALRTEKLYFDSQTSQIADADEVKKFYNVPLQCVAHYVKRASLEALLRLQLEADSAKYLSRSIVVVIHGLAGSGKTQLALNYIQETQSEYDGIFWVQLGGKHTVEDELTPICRWMMAGQNLSGPDLNLTLTEMASTIKSWFKGRSGRWLWVMDSADNLDDPSDKTYVNLTEVIPQDPSVTVIITTRSTAARDISSSKPIEVDKMDEAQACELFWRSSKIDVISASRRVRKDCESIVKELGYLALAVCLAGAAISESPRMSKDPGLYLLEYRQNRKKLLQKQPGWIGTQYSNNILASWEMSYGHVKRRSLLAANLLGFLALLDFKDLYLAMFESALLVLQARSGDRIPFQHTDWLMILLPGKEGTIDINMIEEAFSVLCSFSLVQYDKSLDTYTMHELVHAWGFERLDDDQQLRMGPAVCGFIDIGLINAWEDPKALARLAQHVMPCFTIVSTTIQKKCRNRIFELHFLGQCSSFLSAEYLLGRWKNASTISRYILNHSTRLLGREHSRTMTAMGRFADCLIREKDIKQSERVMRELIAIRERELGTNHSKTMVARAGLAVTLTADQRFDEAWSIIVDVLEGLKEQLGEDHPETVLVMASSASILRGKGQYDEAETIIREVLEKAKRLWGETDPLTLDATEHLSYILIGQERWDEAAAVIKGTIEMRRSAMGENHPYLHENMHNLAHCKARQWKLEEAKSILEKIPEHGRLALQDSNDGTISWTPEFITRIQELIESEDTGAWFREQSIVVQQTSSTGTVTREYQGEGEDSMNNSGLLPII